MTRASLRDEVKAWVDAFNRSDVEAVTNLYREDHGNHRVAEDPVEECDAIREMFATQFSTATMACLPEHIFRGWRLRDS
jgi:ketosteroid isomerase-like protein